MFNAKKKFEKAIEKYEGMTHVDELYELYKYAKKSKDGVIVEVGSWRGKSTVALAMGSMAGNNTPVFAIEPHEEFKGVFGGEFGPEDRKEFMKNMVDSGAYQVVRLVNLGSTQVNKSWEQPVSVLFIDGDHRYEGVKSDYQAWEKHVNPGSFVIFDDTNLEDAGPRKLVDELIANKELALVKTVNKFSILKKL